jgi:hypothetical protein
LRETHGEIETFEREHEVGVSGISRRRTLWNSRKVDAGCRIW